MVQNRFDEGIRLDPAVLHDRAKGMRAQGLWIDKTIDDFLAQGILRHPEKIVVIDYRADSLEPRRISYRELGSMVDRAAGSLLALGVGKNDVISIQLPNWWEYVVTVLACARLGATANPIVPILREREVRYMVGFCGAKVLVVPSTYRGFNHAEMAEALRDSLPRLEHVLVVGGEGDRNFERALLQTNSVVTHEAADRKKARLQPDDLLLLMYTSGTTGEPKGVMHTSNTVNGNILMVAKGLELTSDDVIFAVSPVGHLTGYVSMVLSIALGATMVMQDPWDVNLGLRIMDAEGVTFTSGSTPFLMDICEAAIAGPVKPSNLRKFYCAGAPIPPFLVQKALAELNLSVCSLWGMTEVVAGTMTPLSEVAEKSSSTDGRPLPGVEVRVVDNEGAELPVGQSGRLLVRGASLFCGYLKRPELYNLTSDGWFDTGDLARIQEAGYIRITGRTKDLLIRGGENIPVVEIENLLSEHPAVAEVCIIGYPDPRLGERACAFVVPRPRWPFELSDARTYLESCKVAKQYWPERIELVDELPRTASGKVQRFALREIAKSFERRETSSMHSLSEFRAGKEAEDSDGGSGG